MTHSADHIDIQTLRDVLQGTDWQPGQTRTQLDQGFQNQASSCRFYAISNAVVPGAGVMRFVLDAGGGLLARSGDLDGLAQVLRQCLSPAADALAWATTIARFSSVLSPRVIEADDKLAQAAIPPGQYRPPALRVVGGQTQVEFFMVSHDRRVSFVEAVLPAAGPLQLSVRPLG